jgi:hypothetical protein
MSGVLSSLIKRPIDLNLPPEYKYRIKSNLSGAQLPPGSCRPTPPGQNPPPGGGTADEDENAGFQSVLTVGTQNTFHYQVGKSPNYTQAAEHAGAVALGINYQAHPEGRRGLELQFAATFLYDYYYVNATNQSLEALKDHSLRHSTKAVQAALQGSYVWPFAVKQVLEREDGKDKLVRESLVDFSLLAQLVGAYQSQYDYTKHDFAGAWQWQLVVGFGLAIKPFNQQPNSPLKNVFFGPGVQFGVTGSIPGGNVRVDTVDVAPVFTIFGLTW